MTSYSSIRLLLGRRSAAALGPRISSQVPTTQTPPIRSVSSTPVRKSPPPVPSFAQIQAITAMSAPAGGGGGGGGQPSAGPDIIPSYPEITQFGALKIILCLIVSCYIGSMMAKFGAQALEEFELFVPEDDDDDDD